MKATNYPHWIVRNKSFNNFKKAFQYAEKKSLELGMPISIIERLGFYADLSIPQQVGQWANYHLAMENVQSTLTTAIRQAKGK